MKTYFLPILISASLFLSSCAGLSQAATETLEEAKSGLVCIEYKDNLTWQKVKFRGHHHTEFGCGKARDGFIF